MENNVIENRYNSLIGNLKNRKDEVLQSLQKLQETYKQIHNVDDELTSQKIVSTSFDFNRRIETLENHLSRYKNMLSQSDSDIRISNLSESNPLPYEKTDEDLWLEMKNRKMDANRWYQTIFPSESTYLQESARKSDDIKLQKQYASLMLQRTPGFGKISGECVETLVDSGLPPEMSVELIQAIYQPTGTSEIPLGQGNRTKFFTPALIRQIGEDYLEKASRDPVVFRRLIGEIAEMDDLRESLKEEGYTITFEDSLFLHQFGMNSEYFFSLATDMEIKDLNETNYKKDKFVYTKRILKAARESQKSGHNLESHLKINTASSEKLFNQLEKEE